jgi:CBS domain-containing protein
MTFISCIHIAYLKPMSGMEKKFIETLVGDVYEQIVKKPSVVRRDSKIKEVIESMLQNPLSRKVYVVDADGKLLGMVNTETVLRLIGYRVGVRELGGLSFYRFMRDMFKEEVSTLIAPTRSVTRDTKLTEALDTMIREHVNDLPVVDADGRLIGELVSLELFLKGKELFNKDDAQ